LLLVIGLVMLYLLRGPIVSILLFVLEFLAIVVALILVIVGIALLVGGHWVRRRFWVRT
jgi:hypothetical protein